MVNILAAFADKTPMGAFSTTMASEIRDAFVTGSEFAESHYKCEINILNQRIESLTNQIGEIIGGVPFGPPYIIKN